MLRARPIPLRRAWLLAIAATLSAAPQPQDLKFNLATIKLNPNPAGPRWRIMPGGRFEGTATLEDLIAHAFGVSPLQVSGARGWIGSERFDVDAKAEGTSEKLPEEQFQRMLQALLSERFALKIHKESRQMPVYALIVGPKGSKLKPRGAGPASIPPSMPGKSRLMAISIPALTRALSSMSGRLVLDKTNLTGDYLIVLDYSNESASGSSQPDISGAIIDALEEELGLKLVPRKEAVDIMVIDHAEHPVAN